MCDIKLGSYDFLVYNFSVHGSLAPDSLGSAGESVYTVEHPFPKTKMLIRKNTLKIFFISIFPLVVENSVSWQLTTVGCQVPLDYRLSY